MKNKKALLIALSLVVAISIAYAAVTGVLTIQGNGTLGDVSAMEFLAANGSTTVSPIDITVDDDDDTGFFLSPSQIVIDGETITFNDISFPTVPGTDDVGFVVDFLLNNAGSTDVDVSAAVTNMEITLDNGLILRKIGDNLSSNNPELMAAMNDVGDGFCPTDFIEFNGDAITAIPGGNTYYAGLAPTPFTFGLNLPTDAETDFGTATENIAGEAAGHSLADATFTFSITFDYDVA